MAKIIGDFDKEVSYFFCQRLKLTRYQLLSGRKANEWSVLDRITATGPFFKVRCQQKYVGASCKKRIFSMSTEQQPKIAEGSDNQILYRLKETIRPDWIRTVTLERLIREIMCSYMFQISKFLILILNFFRDILSP
jgi:hypothetical protein